MSNIVTHEQAAEARERFEEWALRNHISRLQLDLNTPMVDWTWRAWQAASVALVHKPIALNGS